jgi:hypothetical protein
MTYLVRRLHLGCLVGVLSLGLIQAKPVRADCGDLVFAMWAGGVVAHGAVGGLGTLMTAVSEESLSPTMTATAVYVGGGFLGAIVGLVAAIHECSDSRREARRHRSSERSIEAQRRQDAEREAQAGQQREAQLAGELGTLAPLAVTGGRISLDSAQSSAPIVGFGPLTRGVAERLQIPADQIEDAIFEWNRDLLYMNERLIRFRALYAETIARFEHLSRSERRDFRSALMRFVNEEILPHVGVLTTRVLEMM